VNSKKAMPEQKSVLQQRTKRRKTQSALDSCSCSQCVSPCALPSSGQSLIHTGHSRTSVDTPFYTTIQDSNTALQLTVTSVDMSPNIGSRHIYIKSFKNIINYQLFIAIPLHACLLFTKTYGVFKFNLIFS